MAERCEVCRDPITDARQADWRLIDDLQGLNPVYGEARLCKSCARRIGSEEMTGVVSKWLQPIETMANRTQFHPWRLTAVADALAGIHRHLQAEMLVALIRVLQIIAGRADDPRYVDGRNEYAYKLVADMIAAVRGRI